MLKALPSLFPNHLGTASGARVEFYDKFKREADEYDRDFMKKYEEDLNTTLIFVSILSTSTSTLLLIRLFGGLGRFVLRGHLGFHRRRSAKPPTGLHKNELCPPPDYRQHLAWEYPNW